MSIDETQAGMDPNAQRLAEKLAQKEMIDKMLVTLNEWLDLRLLCQQVGVEQAKDLPLEVIQERYNEVDKLRTRHKENFIANSVKSEALMVRQEEPDYRRDARLHMPLVDDDKQPLIITDVAATAQEQKIIANAIDRLKWAPKGGMWPPPTSTCSERRPTDRCGPSTTGRRYMCCGQCSARKSKMS